MDSLPKCRSPEHYGINASYIYEYSRGTQGLDVHRDILFTRIVVIFIISMALIILCGRIAQLCYAYLRQINSVAANRRQQAFWSIEDSPAWANTKKHLLWAPMGRKRHNREIQLSSAVNVGTLPSRFQGILIMLYFASQIAYCGLLDYNGKIKAAIFAELRARSGTLAVLNMLPLFILAGRNDPFIPLLRVSFDTYNLFHRWFGRIVAIESVVHTVAWVVNAFDEGGQSGMLERLRTTPFFTWGMVGTAAMLFLCLHSPSPIRHAFYETFLHLHQLAACLTLLCVFLHLDLDGLPMRTWTVAATAIWFLERFARLTCLIHLNFSLNEGTTKLVIEALPGEACRVTFHLPKRVLLRPGSHVYAYIPIISLWMSHPFSVAWVESSTRAIACESAGMHLKARSINASSLEKQAIVDFEKHSPRDSQLTSVSLIVCARRGMTRKLYNKAAVAPGQTLYTSGFIEGPYTCHTSDAGSYGTVILFSAGAGITHHMLLTRDLIIRAYERRAATRRVCLIWSVRNTEYLTWVRTWMNQILQLPSRREILTTLLFVSKPRNSEEIVSPSSTVKIFPGRCCPNVILDQVLPERVGATLISVCGPGAFADEVRVAARMKTGKGIFLDFVEEAFTW